MVRMARTLVQTSAQLMNRSQELKREADEQVARSRTLLQDSRRAIERGRRGPRHDSASSVRAVGCPWP
jgi:hypothetical protein